MKTRLIWLVVAMAFAVPAVAQKSVEIPPEDLEQILKVKIRAVERLAANKVLIDAVKEQNSKRMSLDQIKRIDKEWMSSKDLTPFKRSLQDNPSGQYLRRHVTRNPTYGEAFLTDNQGANVAAYPATSDYWQGDEDKWINSFNTGKGKVFVGSVKFDDSSKTHQAQISVPVFDGDKTIGVLVVGVKLDYIAWKQNRSARRY